MEAQEGETPRQRRKGANGAIQVSDETHSRAADQAPPSPRPVTAAEAPAAAAAAADALQVIDEDTVMATEVVVNGIRGDGWLRHGVTDMLGGDYSMGALGASNIHVSASERTERSRHEHNERNMESGEVEYKVSRHCHAGLLRCREEVTNRR
jgi:D-alanyl-D-alanine carboxypeptidase